MAIISSVYTATTTPYIFKHAMGGLVNFVNFLGTEDNPSGSTTNFKKFFLHWILNILSLLEIYLLSNKASLKSILVM